MTNEDLEKIKAYIRTYLKPPLSDEGSPWLQHHVDLNLQLFEWAKNENQKLSLDQYLRTGWTPKKSKRRR